MIIYNMIIIFNNDARKKNYLDPNLAAKFI